MEEEKEKNNFGNSELIYQEISAYRSQQHEDINLLNQKINWVLASDVLFFGFILQMNIKNSLMHILALAFLIISVIICFISLFARDYRFGPKLMDIHKKRTENEQDLIDSINNKIIQDLDKNQSILKEFANNLKLSTILLLLSLLLVFVKFLSYNLCDIQF